METKIYNIFNNYSYKLDNFIIMEEFIIYNKFNKISHTTIETPILEFKNPLYNKIIQRIDVKNQSLYLAYFSNMKYENCQIGYFSNISYSKVHWSSNGTNFIIDPKTINLYINDKCFLDDKDTFLKLPDIKNLNRRIKLHNLNKISNV